MLGRVLITVCCFFGGHAYLLPAFSSPRLQSVVRPASHRPVSMCSTALDVVHTQKCKRPLHSGLFSRGALPLSSATTSAALTLGLVLLSPALALASGGAEHLHLGQKVALFFQQTGLPNWAVLMLISATPAVELRGGVPVGNWMGISPAATFLICVLGNMLPIAPTLLALRSAFVKKLAAPLLTRAEKKLAGLPKGQSRTLALALFVGIPAPGTGAWTGAIIAYLLDMPFTTSMGAILAGVLLAGVIMTVLTVLGKFGALLALSGLIFFGVGAIFQARKNEEGE